MNNARKKHAHALVYVSPNQLRLKFFRTPFDQQLKEDNRWVVLGILSPWNEVCNLYLKHMGINQTERPPLSPRVVIGSLIIKYILNLDERDTVDQISENMYMQYFLGYTAFTPEAPFDTSLFVEFRKRLGVDSLNAINERNVAIKTRMESSSPDSLSDTKDKDDQNCSGSVDTGSATNKGRVIFDATTCPQDIAYPTDLDLLSAAREKSEQLIGTLYDPSLHEKIPRTYRVVARKCYLQTAQKRNTSRNEIHKAVGSQLRFLCRNMNFINRLLDFCTKIPLKLNDYKYFLVIQIVYQQQKEMYDTKTHSIDDRIASIHQPHERPIVRGKAQAKVEFGHKNIFCISGI